MKNSDVINKILKYHPQFPGNYAGCDGYKFGDPNAECNGIATALVPTVDVIRRTGELGCNLLVVHEPIFYSTEDYPDWRAGGKNSVYEEKKALLDKYGITVWRDHDHMHAHNPDSIFTGVIKYLGWENYYIPSEKSSIKVPMGYLFELPETTVKELGQYLEDMRNSAVTEMETAADNVLAIYRVNLENRIERANNILKNLTLSEETALEMIRSDKESDRYYAKKSIYTAIHAALLQDNAVDLLIVAENSYGGYMESTNGDSSKWALPYETRKAVETFTWELLGSGTRKNSWTIQEIAGEPFLYRAYMRNGHIVAAYISVQNFFSSNTDPAISSLCLALTDSNGYVFAILAVSKIFIACIKKQSKR